MKHNLIIVTIFIFINLSCRQKNYLADNIYGNKSMIDFSLDSINVDLDEISLKTYITHSFYSEAGSDFIIAFNGKTHSLDRINTTQNNITHINLKYEGPNAISNEVSAIYVCNFDSIWLYTPGTILLIDSVGHINRKINTFSQDNEFNFPVLMTNFSCCTSKLYYNKNRHSLFYMSVLIKNNKNFYYVSEYFLKNDSVKKYSLTTVDNKNYRTDYGWMQYPNVTYTSEHIIYNFPVESNIYVINIESEESMVFGGKSKYTSNSVNKLNEHFSFSDADRHLNENVHFCEVIYDDINNIYYRLHLSDTECYYSSMNSDTLYYSKALYLMSFNDKFEIIDEIRLDKNKYNYLYFWGIIRGLLYIAKDNIFYKENDFEKIQFDIIKVKNKN